MELLSPTEFTKEKVEAVQDYSKLAGRSMVNLFRRPLYWGDILQQADSLAGGWWVARFILGLDTYQYWTTAYQSLVFRDVFMGLVKPVLFGFVMASVGCYYGITTTGGTQGVGRSTTQAVVAASVLIIMVD